MADQDVEIAESGNRILRHKYRERGFELAIGEEETAEAIRNHVAQHIGDPALVFHEIVSDLVHVDIHWVAPTDARNYHSLVTSGMSDKRMTTPEGAEDCGYAEMVICLPPSWRLAEADLENEDYYWPLRWLKILARLPHEFETWLWAGHTVPHQDPPQPFASNTKLCCALIGAPLLFGQDFQTVRVNREKEIRFLSVVPIYREEMEFKLKHGFDPLWRRLCNVGVTELLDLDRENVCKRRVFRLR